MPAGLHGNTVPRVAAHAVSKYSLSYLFLVLIAPFKLPSLNDSRSLLALGFLSSLRYGSVASKDTSSDMASVGLERISERLAASVSLFVMTGNLWFSFG